MAWLDYWARRPMQAVADRTWGGPKATSFPAFVDAVDQVGGAEHGSPSTESQTGWTASVSSAEETQENGAAKNAVDNNPYTFWHTAYAGVTTSLPAEIVVDTHTATTINGWRYLPRQDGGLNGRVKQYELSTATTDTGPYTLAGSGTLANDATEKEIPFPPVTARYIKLRVLSEWGTQNQFASAAEIDVLRPAPTDGLADGLYTLTDGFGKALDVPGRSTVSGTQIIQWTPHGGTNQQWRLTGNTDSTYSIANVNSGYCLDIASSSTAAGAKVVQSPCTGIAAQRWRIAANGASAVTVRDAGSNLSLTIKGSTDLSPATQEVDTAAAGQRWTFTRVG
ncbi:RICIN domain-containing protein [Kitasatospora sp. NPDC057015]|uniref:RICIN domain-containing protein n=1 Tax=Kitasatospora sp. NPDC057015 TaxID=3346001 RepID=UPI0036300E23